MSLPLERSGTCSYSCGPVLHEAGDCQRLVSGWVKVFERGERWSWLYPARTEALSDHVPRKMLENFPVATYEWLPIMAHESFQSITERVLEVLSGYGGKYTINFR